MCASPLRSTQFFNVATLVERGDEAMYLVSCLVSWSNPFMIAKREGQACESSKFHGATCGGV